MFPFMNNNNNSSYPLFYNQSPSFTTSLEANNYFQHHQELLYNNNYSILASSNSSIPPNSDNPLSTLLVEAPIINLETTLSNNNNNPSSIPSKRAIGKRDRHTKICTAQGVRDRRVRLSIHIAQEFFNLQDMLGYDKPSKTLGWLLEKSKDAIRELVSSTCTSDVVTQNTNDKDIGQDAQNDDARKNVTTTKKRGKREHCYGSDQIVAKAVRRTKRANARERARERTKNKKSITCQRNFTNLETYLEQKSMFNQAISSSSSPAGLISYGSNKGVGVGDSVVVKNKSREPCHSYNNYYGMLTKDFDHMGCTPINYHNDHNNAGGIIHTPGLSALSIINLSTEIHIKERQWDTYNNHNVD